jgi:glucan biosynthesis protein C
MQGQVVLGQTDERSRPTVRLHYLDWLRVLAILGVFLYHAVHPFDFPGWHIKNAELSMTVTVVLGLFFPWGMPFFFLIAGTGSWFALRRRTAGQYATERFKRLFIPYVAGCILLWPIMLYFEWSHKIQTGVVQGSFLEFLKALPWGPNPRLFGVVGYHLWFLGFLFCFSLFGLPIFLWLKGESGQAVLSRLARVCARRGGILVFVLPLLLVRLALQPFFPQEHNWADFFYLMAMFVLGFVLYAHQGFTCAIRRDWPILLATAIVSTVVWAYLALTAESLDVYTPPRTLRDFVFWIMVTINSWCWTTFMLFIGMRYLDFSNKWLQYGQEAVLPFFLLHQPVIIVIAFYVVQWYAGIPVKLATVVLASFAVTLGIYELVIRRVAPLRALFGMKVRSRTPVMQPQEATPASGAGTQPSG